MADDPDVVIASGDDAHRFARRLVDELGIAPSAAASESHACTLSPDELPARPEQVRQLIGGLQDRTSVSTAPSNPDTSADLSRPGDSPANRRSRAASRSARQPAWSFVRRRC